MNIFLAIKNDDLKAVHDIVENDINQLNRLATMDEDIEISNSIRISYIEDTPLLYAARHHRVEIFDYLISKGADINSTNTYGYNVFMNSLQEGVYKENIDSSIYFLEQPGLNMSHVSAGKYDALGILLKAIHHISLQDDVRYINGKAYTPADFNEIKLMVNILLNKGFSINKAQGKRSDENAVHISASQHNWQIVAYLITLGGDYSTENYMKWNIWTFFLGNEYLPPEYKQFLFQLIYNAAESNNFKYGKIEQPENFYVCPISGKIQTFNRKRYAPDAL